MDIRGQPAKKHPKPPDPFAAFQPARQVCCKTSWACLLHRKKYLLTIRYASTGLASWWKMKATLMILNSGRERFFNYLEKASRGDRARNLPDFKMYTRCANTSANSAVLRRSSQRYPRVADRRLFIGPLSTPSNSYTLWLYYHRLK